MKTMGQDVRFGLRMLRKSPGFALAAVVCIALGIGANTTIFSVVSAMLYRPLPFGNPQRVAVLEETQVRYGGDGTSVSFPNFYDWRERSTSFEAMAVYDDRDFALSGAGGEPERIDGQVVSASLFSIIGVVPVLGRDFTAAEDQPGAAPVAILGHTLWQRRFNGDPEIIGREVTINSRPTTIVGVMPEGFKFPEWAELWMPAAFNISEMGRGAHSFEAVALLRPGVSLEQANAELRAIAAQLEQQYPETNTGWSVRAIPYREARVGEIRPVLYIMLGAVGFVLLIACANVANLLLARGAAREKEIAIRTALGAGRWRIIRQLLTESILLALAGGALGILLAMWGIDLVLSAIPIELPYWIRFTIDGRVLLFTAGVALLTGLIFGFAPALGASKPDLNEVLKEGGRSAAGGARGRRAGSALVIAEVALSLVLLIGAALMIQSFMRLTQVDPGYEPRGVMTMQLSLPVSRYADEARRASFYSELLRRINELPDIESAAAINRTPLGGGTAYGVFILEGTNPAPSEEPVAETRVVTPGYFDAMRIPLLRGREFTERETAEAPRTVIINEWMAQRYWPGEDAIGKQIRLTREADAPRYTIIGVARDVKQQRGLDARPAPQLYTPHAQSPGRSMTIVARAASGDAAGLTASIRNVVRQMDSELPLYNARTMEEVIALSAWQPRLYGQMFAVFAAGALLLAAVGVYGVISYAVAQRTREIGIRLALGAQPGDVLKMVLRQGMKLALIGIALGLAAALALTRVMAGLLYGVNASDPTTFAGVALLLAAIAFMACYIPARRAMKVDPMEALRYE